MNIPSSSPKIDVHYECLDVFSIKSPSAGIEDHGLESGILVEIWRTGGMVQTSLAIAEGSWVELTPAGRTIAAQVTSCEQDEYGFLVSVTINQDQYDNWFPHSYCPPHLRCDDQDIERFGFSENTAW
jgi:hypothetical protein